MARQLYTPLSEITNKRDFDANLGANLSDNSRISEDLGRIASVCRKSHGNIPLKYLTFPKQIANKQLF